MKKNTNKAFTLIELLVVMVIIGILAALIVPNVSGAFTSARKSKTITFFKGLEGAFEQYYAEYKTLPKIGSGSGAIGINSGTNTSVFIETLTGRRRSGTGAITGDALNNNPRLVPFFSFDSSMVLDSDGEPDYATGKIVDAFGNTDINMVMATDPANPSIGRPSAAVRASSTPGGPGDIGSGVAPPTNTPGTIYKRVIFYSPGKGQVPADTVMSW